MPFLGRAALVILAVLASPAIVGAQCPTDDLDANGVSDACPPGSNYIAAPAGSDFLFGTNGDECIFSFDGDGGVSNCPTITCAAIQDFDLLRTDNGPVVTWNTTT